MSDQSQTGQVDGAGGPLAYFITFTCCGTWLHGQDAGSVDRRHNQPDTSVLPADTARRQENRDRMGQEPYELDSQRRPIVLEAIREVCSYRQWRLLAVHVRARHVHVVVQAPTNPERVMNDFKAYASRALNAAGLDPSERKRWTRHGSTRYLWTPPRVDECVHYTLHEQGEPMAAYAEEDAESRDLAEPRPR